MAGRRWGRSLISLGVCVALATASLATIGVERAPAQASQAKASSAKDLPGLPSEPAPARRTAMPGGNFSNPPPTAGMPERPPPPGRFDPATSTEVTSQTSPTRKVFSNADGSHTAVVSAGPARVRNPRGGFDDIDLGLEPGPGNRLRSRTSPTPLSIASATAAGSSLADVDLDGASVSLSVDGTAAGKAAEVDRARGSRSARFSKSLPEAVSVEVAPLASGVETTYVLDQAPKALPVERLSLPAGWSAHQVQGDVELLDATGAVKARWGGPLPATPLRSEPARRWACNSSRPTARVSPPGWWWTRPGSPTRPGSIPSRWTRR